MSVIAIHPLTERQLTAFREQPSHAVVLIGPVGSGKLTLARQLAESILDLPPGGFADYAYGMSVAPIDGKAIGIEAVRTMEHFLSLKVPRPGDINRAVIIDSADKLTLEAQNALLKTLEEPPLGTIIILTAAHNQAMLPTIRSRAMTIHVQRPERAALENHFKGASDIQRVYAVSGGLPGLMTALLEDPEHPLRAATERARQLLSQTVYERLLTIDELAKQRQAALDTLFILQNMAHLSLQTAVGSAARRWQAVLIAAYDAQAALEDNAQPKLALTDLMLRL